MSDLKLILLSVRSDRACATIDIIRIILSERERERERERENEFFKNNFPVFIFKYDDNMTKLSQHSDSLHVEELS